MPENTDLFGRSRVRPIRPIIADMATIHWAGEGAGAANGSQVLAKATNVSVSYQQNVTRRRTLGGYGNVAVLIPSQPIGSLSIQRLYAEPLSDEAASADLFNDLPGCNVCKGTAAVSIYFNGDSAFPDCNFRPDAYLVCRGTTVTGYNLQMDAESLMVADSLQAEFLQLTGKTPK